MKVLAVAPQPFFVPRGTPFSVYYRTLVLAEQGAEIDLLTYGAGADVEIARVRHVRIPRLRLLEPIPIGPSWRKLLLDFFMIVWTIALLARHRYQVVHAHEEAVFWCRFLKPVFRFKLVYDMHSSLPQQLENFRFTRSRLLIGIFEALENSALKAADAVVTICPALEQYALAAGVVPERHLLIENSIFEDVSLRTPAGAPTPGGTLESDPSGPLILYAGTFEAYQGIELLLDAFAIVLRSRPESRLLLAGGTPDQVERIAVRAKELGVDERCRLTGRVAKSVVADFTRAATVLVSPRICGTNTPLKVYEQLASGKPLVATRIESHTQVLDDDVAYLVEPDPEALAAGLLAALADGVEGNARARNAAAKYAREYARPVYEEKVRRLIGLVA